MNAKNTTESYIKLIVGLGNPGPEYANTRHNAGQDLVENLARQYGGNLAPTPKHFGFTSKITINNREIRLLIPTTFMNRSGQAVASVANFYKLSPEEILVAHDELDLDPGIARLKKGGGHGGHNGLKDITSALANNKNFARLRLGIGHPGSANLVSGYVLRRAPNEEANKIEDAIDASLKQIPTIIAGDWELAMRELHTKK